MRFALLGHPVGHSLSPAIHAAAFAELGLPHTYTLHDAPTDADLVSSFDLLRRGDLDGANVTVPHKRLALTLADAIADSASAVGAANVIVRRGDGRLTAHNTDADALAADIAESLGDRPRRSAAIVGAGGAGLAAAVAAKKLGFSDVTVTTFSWTSPEKISISQYLFQIQSLNIRVALFPNLSISHSETENSTVFKNKYNSIDWLKQIADADLVIQATSSGMAGRASTERSGRIEHGDIFEAIPLDRLKRTALLYDVVYNPRETPLVEAARARGIEAMGGIGMLVRQAALSFTLWTGLEAPIAAMRAAVGVSRSP